MKRRDLTAAAAVLPLLWAFAAQGNDMMKIDVTDGKNRWTLVLEDNATARALTAKLPLTLDFADLYGRELCYRFREALPANEVRVRGYRPGEVIYWPPRHSLVIMYAQNGETFDMQTVGRIEGDLAALAAAGDVTLTLTLEK